MSSKLVETEERGWVGLIRLDDPTTLNSVSIEMVEQLSLALRERDKVVARHPAHRRRESLLFRRHGDRWRGRRLRADARNAHEPGRVRAMEMMLLGERLPATRALEWGLINYMVSDDTLEAAAMALAERLANGPSSLTQMRRMVWKALDNELGRRTYDGADRADDGRTQRGLRRGHCRLPGKTSREIHGGLI